MPLLACFWYASVTLHSSTHQMVSFPALGSHSSDLGACFIWDKHGKPRGICFAFNQHDDTCLKYLNDYTKEDFGTSFLTSTQC